MTKCRFRAFTCPIPLNWACVDSRCIAPILPPAPGCLALHLNAPIPSPQRLVHGIDIPITIMAASNTSDWRRSVVGGVVTYTNSSTCLSAAFPFLCVVRQAISVPVDAHTEHDMLSSVQISLHACEPTATLDATWCTALALIGIAQRLEPQARPVPTGTVLTRIQGVTFPLKVRARHGMSF